MAVFPLPSVTVQITEFAPSEYVVEGWLLETEATEQLSAVTGVPRAAARTVAVQVPAPTFTVMLAGQVIVGLILSTTVTV